MYKRSPWSAIVVLLALLAGCSNWNENSGVNNQWRAPDVPLLIGGLCMADHPVRIPQPFPFFPAAAG